MQSAWRSGGAGFGPLTGSSRFAFARFGHGGDAPRSQVSCAALGFPGCCLILRTVYKKCDIIFPPAVMDKSQSANFGFTWQN